MFLFAARKSTCHLRASKGACSSTRGAPANDSASQRSPYARLRLLIAESVALKRQASSIVFLFVARNPTCHLRAPRGVSSSTRNASANDSPNDRISRSASDIKQAATPSSSLRVGRPTIFVSQGSWVRNHFSLFLLSGERLSPTPSPGQLHVFLVAASIYAL